MDDDSDYSHDSSIDDDLENLYTENEEHSYADKKNAYYYLGICKYISTEDYFLSIKSISPRMLYNYPYQTVIRYLQDYSFVYVRNPKIDIMQLVIMDNLYTVIVKTVWLRIVQRSWRRVLRERAELWKKRMSLGNLRHREICGRYLPGSNSMPGLRGMIKSMKR
jgi:hypothetical protein